MILNVSGRTDIVAFYTPWFMNRIHEGFVDVRNPFNPKMVSRIFFDDVDAILFCTKNPKPIIPYLSEINKPIIFHITLTGYNKEIEPNVNKKGIIESIKDVSKIIGKCNTVVRYDPVFLNNKYTVDYHTKAIKKIAEELDGYIDKIIISFLDNYKNVRKNMDYLRYRELTDKDYENIGINFSKTVKEYNIGIQTCFEDHDLTEYGFEKGECLSHELAFALTGKKYPEWKARTGKKCHCVQMVDIGMYNTCPHLCKYCYANFDEESVQSNYLSHDPKSSLLCGKIEPGDIIKRRLK